MLYAAKSHVGLVRQMNEDGFAISESNQPMTLLMVADGMGGASAGEVASKVAVDTVTNAIATAKDEDWVKPDDLLFRAIDSANREICSLSASSPEYSGMGTTVVAVLADEKRVVVAHVGDSRVYALQNGQFRQVTKDHSLVAELVRRGQLTEEEAQHHPQRHIVTRSLGTSEFGYADVQTFEWSKADVMLLCSDGLSNLVNATELRDTMEKASACQTPQELETFVDTLLSLALMRGGHDNITVILTVCDEAGAPK